VWAEASVNNGATFYVVLPKLESKCMSDSFVEKLTLIVAMVLWARASEFDFREDRPQDVAKPRDSEGGPQTKRY